MKKLLFLAAVLFALCACNRDEMNSPSNSPGKTEIAPHFYGWMTLDNAAPETRGVANSSKVWSRPMAEKNLTVKFLNGTERYQEFVKEVAPEWEKYANVKFEFVSDDQDALIRVGFDYVKGMSSSWALTGTDHLQVYDKQDEATVHFSQWRRASDAAKRSDVLRAFGQVLGLELEFRHPDFTPGWITDANGNIDEETIREYWEYELNGLISWEELKKVVLDPLNVPAFLIEKTDTYDSNSVMSWPFYEMIAQNIPVVEFDEDYKTELSEQDKVFIARLYGEPKGGDITIPESVTCIVPLVKFDYTGSKFRISLSTSSNLIIDLNKNTGELVKGDSRYISIPEGAETPYTVTIEHEYTGNNLHHITISEIAKSTNGAPTESYALQGFDLQTGVGMENLNFQPQVPNKALSYVRVRGGDNFKAQQFNFENNECLKELYLSQIGNSTVTVNNCQNLEVFATTPFIAKWDLESMDVDLSGVNRKIRNMALSLEKHPIEELVFERPSLIVMRPDTIPTYPWHPDDPVGPTLPDSLVVDPPGEQFFQPWPADPQQSYSLNGTGLTISNCPNLRKISLDHTQIQTFDFSAFKHLEYVYLSSTPEYIIDGLASGGNNLKSVLTTLVGRPNKDIGKIIIRGMAQMLGDYGELRRLYYGYTPVKFDKYSINTTVTIKNWAICWDPTYEFRVLTTSND
ncbi:hypothetical protein [uncultured Parabacteroides sp.]|uniref:hypothetical protein n=1 Tax=uncultured Parabacteroides sp. TaxID=512312 RepID=UPI002658C7D6|nr:hypothetical protein [uncultured Parabacteroides sp.]